MFLFCLYVAGMYYLPLGLKNKLPNCISDTQQSVCADVIKTVWGLQHDWDGVLGHLEEKQGAEGMKIAIKPRKKKIGNILFCMLLLLSSRFYNLRCISRTFQWSIQRIRIQAKTESFKASFLQQYIFENI